MEIERREMKDKTVKVSTLGCSECCRYDNHDYMVIRADNGRVHITVDTISEDDPETTVLANLKSGTVRHLYSDTDVIPLHATVALSMAATAVLEKEFDVTYKKGSGIETLRLSAESAVDALIKFEHDTHCANVISLCAVLSNRAR